MDGAFLLAPGRDDPVPAALRSSSLPVVFSGRPWPADPGLHVIDRDNVGGAFDATTFLLGQGRRCVVIITGPLDQSAAVDRLTGWTHAIDADDAVASRLAETEVPDGGPGSAP